MKICTVKQECSDGDKATITGRVKWIGEIDTHEGKEGQFCTQTILVVDGEKTDDKRNSMFCKFYADDGNWNHLKDTDVTVQGAVNVWKNKISLQGCKVKDAPQNTQ